MRNRPVTIKDIARRLGISYSTVSRALSPRMSHLVKEQTRMLVRRTAEDMDYAPNLMAQAFVKGTMGVLGLVTGRIGLEITGRQINHLVRTANEHGYQVLVAAVPAGTAASVEDEQAELFMQLKSRDVDGILIHAPGGGTGPFPIPYAAEGNLPVTTLGYAADDAECVSLDLASGVQEATEHLIELGHERICLLGEDWFGMDGPRTFEKGYRDAMRRHGLAPRVVPADAARVGPGYSLGRALRDRFTALACCCDYTALGVCRGLIESGVRVPEDVAVTGFGDYEVSAYVNPALTTLSIPYEDMAAAAVHGILRQLQGKPVPGRSVFKPRLTVRESCGAS